MEEKTKVRDFTAKLFNRMYEWETKCAERMERIDSGEVSHDEAWKLIRTEVEEIREEFLTNGESEFTGDAFSNFPKYDIEVIEEVEKISRDKFQVLTKRFLPKRLNQKFRYAIHMNDEGELRFGSREMFRSFEDIWEPTYY